MIDHLVTGRYKIESQIGSGGMGIVYRAHDTKLRRDVALKVIAPHLVEDEPARARFLTEAQALAGLSHPNIVTVFDLSEEPETGLVFIVMELLNGLPLRKRITDPSRPAFYDMAIQVCRALEHAHANGVLHRDIKPENIFVCSDGTIKLMDFGLARLVDGATVNSSGMVTGTVAYMSPEQLRGGALDPRADLYGLGVVFYEYLCGFTPFSSDSPGTMLLKHLTEPAPSIRILVPSVAPDLDQLIQRLLEKDPASRYPSAMILRDSLERIRASGPVSTQIAAPQSAGPAMPATLMPLASPQFESSGDLSGYVPMVAPRSQRLKPTTTTIRSVSSPPRQTGRYVGVFCVVLLGMILAFAFGESLQRMIFPSLDPPKKTDIAKKPRGPKQKPAASRSSRRPRKVRRVDQSPSKPQDTAEQNPKPGGADKDKKTVEAPTDAVPDDKPDTPDPDPMPPPDNKGETDT